MRRSPLEFQEKCVTFVGRRTKISRVFETMIEIALESFIKSSVRSPEHFDPKRRLVLEVIRSTCFFKYREKELTSEMTLPFNLRKKIDKNQSIFLQTTKA